MLISSEVFFLNVNIGDRVEMKNNIPAAARFLQFCALEWISKSGVKSAAERLWCHAIRLRKTSDELLNKINFTDKNRVDLCLTR